MGNWFHLISSFYLVLFPSYFFSFIWFFKMQTICIKPNVCWGFHQKWTAAGTAAEQGWALARPQVVESILIDIWLMWTVPLGGSCVMNTISWTPNTMQLHKLHENYCLLRACSIADVNDTMKNINVFGFFLLNAR